MGITGRRGGGGGGVDSPAERMMSPEEYEALPASIQKKYFSTSERQLITQQGPNQPATPRPIHHSRNPTPEPGLVSTLPSNWKPNPDRKIKQSMTSSLLRSRRFPSRTNLEQPKATVSEDQAAWFLSLPDKVKRQHFSKEERTLLALRCEIVLDKKAPIMTQESAQDFCRRRLTAQFESGNTPKHRRRSSAPMSVRLDDGVLEEIVAADAPEVVDEAEADHVSVLSLYTRRHSIAAAGEDTETPLPVVPPAQIRSFRRSFALKPLPLAAPILAPMDPPAQVRSSRRAFALTPLPLAAPILAPVPSPGFFKDRDQQSSGKQRRRPPPVLVASPELSPDAKHYKDPEMRKTLQAMSSPELFDEVLEFGFPQAPSNSRPSTARKRSKSSETTSEHDRSSSLTSSSTAETKDLPSGTCCPPTPDGAAELLNAAHATNATATAPERSHQLAPPGFLRHRAHTSDTTGTHTHHTRTPSALNRDMTMRMTLTRPLLRATETDVHLRSVSLQEPPQRDPLALERLTICDDPTGAQGAFAVPNIPHTRQGFKYVLKQLVGK